ncbi:class I SAM-dependent methyltransferase [Allokutzneria sp. A3M-2-11 16]|uniref:class I SAM-dependent methyltransferase n=1 Tax=Allokutzneria sp. A3M-2-11 16 TaxID=2962043 RepID=UPI0020B7A20A|nr:class I SAM-dependent methyltransferase [Allokutzneria sp. A3M-2-11 16]MCP3804034.1 class I SAM-dependent methyltransferase [Allokutzneria sp. A3M-2-11 16]
MDREKITLTGAQETMLATLYARALDSVRPDPVLGDVAAADAVRRIDYDFRKTGIKGTSAVGVALRAKTLDDWTREFLAANPECTVLHLACGLDTRVHRMAPPASVRWIDVDFPEVVELRERLLPTPPGDYTVISSSVTDDAWLEQVPADRPVVAVFEGLSMYLSEEDGTRLVQRITGRFPSGELLFDCYGSMGIKLQKLVPAVRNAGATLDWGIDTPGQIERLHQGLTCVDALRSVDMPGLEKLPLSGRIGMRVIAHIPALRDIGKIMRFRF